MTDLLSKALRGILYHLQPEGDWKDRPVLYVSPARRVTYAPENPADFHYERQIEFEQKKRENPFLASIFAQEDPELCFVDLSAGISPKWRQSIINALEQADLADRRLEDQRPKGWQIHMHYLPPEGVALEKPCACGVNIRTVREGGFDNFLYELAVLVDPAPDARSLTPVYLGSPHFLKPEF